MFNIAFTLEENEEARHDLKDIAASRKYDFMAGKLCVQTGVLLLGFVFTAQQRKVLIACHSILSCAKDAASSAKRQHRGSQV